MTETLSQRLRAETKDAHVASERSGIMRGLLRGTLTRAEYLDLLRNLEPIYDALETEIDRHASRPALRGVDLSILRRRERLELDINYFSTGGASRAIRPATAEYVARLHAIAETSPDLLLAHAYVRYMGDLSGGQMLAAIVAKTFGLENGAGTEFYTFPSIPDAGAFKHAFRDALDAAAAVVAPDDIVREALFGFALHEKLFIELAS